MQIVKSCDVIRQSLVKSNLHYFINESPHSIWITIRKKFIDINVIQVGVSDEADERFESTDKATEDILYSDFKLLVDKHNSLAKAFETMKLNYELEIAEHEVVIKEKSKAIFENEKKEKLVEQLT